MVQIAGKYKLVENKNFYELLVGTGVPEERAKSGNELKGTLNVTVDGNKIQITNDAPHYVTNIIVGEEFEEKVVGDVLFKSTAKLDGNVVTIFSKTVEGQSSGSRTLTFSDAGLEVAIDTPKDGKTYSATRIYKRL